jgi:hypothetical protein
MAEAGSTAPTALRSDPPPSAGLPERQRWPSVPDVHGRLGGNVTLLTQRVVLARRAGYTIKYVIGDTTSTPGGALTAAQKLVEQDHVFAVIAVSSLTFAAANYLT